MTERVRILVVDDHPPVRDAVRMRLQEVPRFEVVGEAGDIQEALAQAEGTRPHLALIDIALGDMNGLLLARQLGVRFPEMRLLIWSMHARREYVEEAMACGVRAYILKSGPLNEIVTAIESVLLGGTYYPPGLDRVGRSMPRRPELTPAEKMVLVLVGKGLSSRQAAKRLKVITRTIETHRSSVMAKLGAKNAVQMVTIAIALGLLDVHDIIPEEGEGD